MLRLSILYRLVRWLLDLSAVLMRRDLSKDTELLVEITYHLQVLSPRLDGSQLRRVRVKQ